MATAETAESTVNLKRAGRQVQRNPQGKVTEARAGQASNVNILDEQEKAGEEADKDIGGVSNIFCRERFDVSDDVGNG